jgi:ribosomal protein S18 acetylase RimI-like enzyme
MEGAAIRPARATDAARIALVHVRSWQGAYRGLLPQAYLDGLDPAQRVGRWEQALAEAQATPAGILVADNGGSLLGFVAYSPSRDADADPGLVGQIGAIYLLPDAWGKGMGRQLLDAAIERLAAEGFGLATLWVLDSNIRARRFYEAGGWSADGTVKNDERRGFPVIQVRYRKSLA